MTLSYGKESYINAKTENQTFFFQYTIEVNSTITGGTPPYTAYYRIDDNLWNNHTCNGTTCHNDVTFPGGDHTICVNVTQGGSEDLDCHTIHFWLKNQTIGEWDLKLFAPIVLLLGWMLLFEDLERPHQRKRMF